MEASSKLAAGSHSRMDGKEETFGLRDILEILASHKIWFIAGVVVSIIAARLYLATQSNIYQRQAVLLVKDDSNGSPSKRSNISTDALMQLNGVLAGTSVKNEVYILHSFQLAREVAKDLQLDVTYSVRRGLRNVSLYKNRPITAVFTTEFTMPASFAFTIDSSKGGTISNVRYGVPMEESDFTTKVEWGEKVKTPFGEMVITPMEGEVGEYAGEKITVRRVSVEDAGATIYNKVTSSEVDKQSTLVRIACTDTDIERADDILNGLLEAYKRSIIDDKNKIAECTSAFIESRIGLIYSDLSNVEGRMAEFKQNNGLVDLKASSDAFLQQSSTARQRTIQSETQYAMVEYLVDYLTQKSAEGELIPTMGGISESGIASQIDSYNKLMLQRNRLAENTSESSPAIKDMDSNLSQMRTAVLASLKGYSASLKLQVEKARSEESGLHGTLHAIPQKEKEAIDIARQKSIKETLYTYLLNKREETALQLAITEANIRIVESPFGSTTPISPRPRNVLMIALLLGLALPFSFFYMKEKLNTTVRGRKDIEENTTIPVLGEIPHRKDGIRDDEIIIEKQNDEVIGEAFRLLRFNMPFMCKDARVIMFSSTIPGEGKTFISRNFAATLGMSGKKVILVDTDIRKRTQSRLFSLGSNVGLTSFLSGEETDVRKLIVKLSERCNLDLLPAGITPPNPAELLMNERLDACIEELKSYYDYIIVDNVPAQVVADAGIVNRVADMTIYVIREGKLDVRDLIELERLHQEKKFTRLCIVLNDITKPSFKYGYNYSYKKPGRKKFSFRSGR